MTRRWPLVLACWALLTRCGRPPEIERPSQGVEVGRPSSDGPDTLEPSDLLHISQRQPPPAASEPPGTIEAARDWWVLVHPNASGVPVPGRGAIYRWHEGDAAPSLKLPLPPSVRSPHGLAFDGTNLWLSAGDENAPLYRLDPASGAV